MELFYVTENQDFNTSFEDGNVITSRLLKPKDKPDMSSIYACTGACIETFRMQIANSKKEAINPKFKIKLLTTLNRRKILNTEDFPKIISNFDSSTDEREYTYTDPLNYKKIPTTPFIPLEKQIEDIDGDEISVFIINGMGTGLGDGMCGLAALNVFYKRLKQKYKKVIIDLGQPMVIGDKNHQSLYSQESIVNSVSYLPIAVEKLIDYDLVLDNSAMIIRENFPNQAMTDFFLENLGIDPKTVPSKEKRIFIKKNERAERMLELPLKMLRRDPKKKLILLHTSASTVMRSMPRDVIKKAIKHILDADPNYIVITIDPMTDIKDDVSKYLAGKKHRHINLSFKTGAFDLYTYIISQMDGIVTVDTSSYHIANAYNVPTVVIFQTIDPKLRVRDYPLCTAIEITKKNELAGIHISQDKKHIETMMGYWRNFDTKKLAESLKSVMIKKRMMLADKANYTDCPICKTSCWNHITDRHGDNQLIECPTCGVEFNTIRKEADYDDLYEGGYKDHYLKEGTKEEILKDMFTKPRMEAFIDFMQSQSANDRTFLDYGCGNGAVVQYAKGLGFDAFGADSSKAAVDYAKTKLELENVMVAQSLDELEDYPKTFDIISSIEILEHLTDPVEFSKQVFERLKPGGFWFVSTPNRNRLQFAAGVKNTKKHNGLETGDYAPEHLQRFRAKTHKFLVEAAGFEVFHQDTCRVTPQTINDISGMFPEVNITVEEGKVVTIPKDGLQTFMFNFYQPLIDATSGNGNFLTTIARKPLT